MIMFCPFPDTHLFQQMSPPPTNYPGNDVLTPSKSTYSCNDDILPPPYPPIPAMMITFCPILDTHLFQQMMFPLS